MKASLKNYSKPRPYIMKVIGDSSVYAGGLFAGISVANHKDVYTLVGIGLMISGNFFSNLFTAIEKENGDTPKENL